MSASLLERLQSVFAGLRGAAAECAFSACVACAPTVATSILCPRLRSDVHPSRHEWAQRVATVRRPDPYAAASQEILELVQSGEADRETVGELADVLLEAEVPFRQASASQTLRAVEMMHCRSLFRSRSLFAAV